MQRLLLRPGPLTPHRVIAPPGSARQTLEYDDLNTSVIKGPVLARLTPLEYALIMALLRQRQLWERAPDDFALCCEVKTLCKIARSTSEQSVHRHLNSATRKIEPLGLRVVRLHAENRYMLLLASDIESQQAQNAPLSIVS